MKARFIKKSQKITVYENDNSIWQRPSNEWINFSSWSKSTSRLTKKLIIQNTNQSLPRQLFHSWIFGPRRASTRRSMISAQQDCRALRCHHPNIPPFVRVLWCCCVQDCCWCVADLNLLTLQHRSLPACNRSWTWIVTGSIMLHTE